MNMPETLAGNRQTYKFLKKEKGKMAKVLI
jgi:hypothetical protein